MAESAARPVSEEPRECYGHRLLSKRVATHVQDAAQSPRILPTVQPLTLPSVTTRRVPGAYAPGPWVCPLSGSVRRLSAAVDEFVTYSVKRRR